MTSAVPKKRHYESRNGDPVILPRPCHFCLKSKSVAICAAPGNRRKVLCKACKASGPWAPSNYYAALWWNRQIVAPKESP